jgi:hypothetical protein
MPDAVVIFSPVGNERAKILCHYLRSLDYWKTREFAFSQCSEQTATQFDAAFQRNPSYFVKAYDVALIYADDHGYLVRYAGYMPAAFLDRDDVVRYLQRCFATMKRLPFFD